MGLKSVIEQQRLYIDELKAEMLKQDALIHLQRGIIELQETLLRNANPSVYFNTENTAGNMAG